MSKLMGRRNDPRIQWKAYVDEELLHEAIQTRNWGNIVHTAALQRGRIIGDTAMVGQRHSHLG